MNLLKQPSNKGNTVGRPDERSSVRATRSWAILAFLVFLMAGCGGGDSKSSESGDETEAACTKSPLAGAPELPKGWPELAEVTYTQESQQGPTTVVEGYFAGDVKAAHDDFKRELESAGFTILFDELEDNDSEVSWKGQGRSGQVALRNECGSSDKVFVHITNRPG
jgi:hypothetical protein